MLTSWPHLAAISLITALTLASGVMTGFFDDRWSQNSGNQNLSGMLPTVPAQVGPWVQISDRELNEDAADKLQCESFLLREFWNSNTGSRVTIAVLYGPRGPIAVHTPEICYSSSGTEVLGDRQVKTIQVANETATFWNIELERSSDPHANLDVWYAWSDGGNWTASEYPRFWITDKLYKLQLATHASTNNASSPAADFLAHFLPVLRRSMIRKNLE